MLKVAVPNHALLVSDLKMADKSQGYLLVYIDLGKVQIQFLLKVVFFKFDLNKCGKSA